MIAAHPGMPTPSAMDRTYRCYEDAGRPQANDLFTRLCLQCGTQAEGNWTAIADAALSACSADAAGVQIDDRCLIVSGKGSAPGPETVERLHAALVRTPKIARHAARDGSHYMAVAIGDTADDGYLWVRRRAEFEWPQALSLRGVTAFATLVARMQARIDEAQLLMLESRHRCLNDLQLVNSLLNFEAAQVGSDDVGHRLEKVSDRVLMLAQARRGRASDLATMLNDYCAAMRGQIEDRGIRIVLEASGEPPCLSEQRLGLVQIAVNEVVTNAVKHAFPDRRAGEVRITLHTAGDAITLRIADDGLPIAEDVVLRRPGSGLDLVTRLLAGARGRLVPPAPGSKVFAIELPAG